ncbi:hypothetical protein F4818DRAFT_441634 [Hypoxylon cercidicola]|nr:hypothetical protein F4818DRAFT_441634 [Hypoxylon cercidicola]
MVAAINPIVTAVVATAIPTAAPVLKPSEAFCVSKFIVDVVGAVVVDSILEGICCDLISDVADRKSVDCTLTWILCAPTAPISPVVLGSTDVEPFSRTYTDPPGTPDTVIRQVYADLVGQQVKMVSVMDPIWFSLLQAVEYPIGQSPGE